MRLSVSRRWRQSWDIKGVWVLTSESWNMTFFYRSRKPMPALCKTNFPGNQCKFPRLFSFFGNLSADSPFRTTQWKMKVTYFLFVYFTGCKPWLYSWRFCPMVFTKWLVIWSWKYRRKRRSEKIKKTTTKRARYQNNIYSGCFH